MLALVLFILPGPGTSYAKPILEVIHLNTVFTDTCRPQADLEWTSTQFAKRDGFLRFFLFKEELLIVKGGYLQIPAGTAGGSGIVYTWMEQEVGKEYRWEVQFYRAKGKNGVDTAKHGRLLMSYLGTSSIC